jgi:hypothetical protein
MGNRLCYTLATSPSYRFAVKVALVRGGFLLPGKQKTHGVAALHGSRFQAVTGRARQKYMGGYCRRCKNPVCFWIHNANPAATAKGLCLLRGLGALRFGGETEPALHLDPVALVGNVRPINWQ